MKFVFKRIQPRQPGFGHVWILLLILSLIMVAPVGRLYAAKDKVIATVGNENITEQQLDQQVKPQIDALKKQLDARLRKQSYDLKQRTLDRMTDDLLLHQAAKRSGMTMDQYLAKQTGDTAAITDAEAKRFYDQHSVQIKAPYDKVKQQIVAHLHQQRIEQKRAELLSKLRKETPVTVELQPIRVTVESKGHPSLGPKNAPVTIVEFSDFQCPFCKRAEPTVKQVLKKYGNQVRFVYMDYPLSFHHDAMNAARAAQCANEQNRFWEYHDALFAGGAKLDPGSLKAAAQRLGLDAPRFDACLDSGKYQAQVNASTAEGNKLGVNGTPTFFINGRDLTGAQPLDAFTRIVDQEVALKGRQKQASAK